MKKIIILTGLILVMCLSVFVSCASASEEAETAPGVMPTTPQPPMVDMGEDLYSHAESALSTPSNEERMIVRTGDMSLVVEDVVTAVDEISNLAESLDGYVVSSWVAGEEQEMRGRITIRVPDEEFENAIDELRNLSVRVDSESTNSRDVTEEYIDLEARLKIAEATEAQYLALLDQAKDVEDILRIYDSLGRIRREIEQIKGQIQYLERTTSMSLLSINLEPAATAKPIVPVGWSLSEVFKSILRGFVIFGQWLLTALIVILILIPVWGTILWLILRRRRRRRESE